MTIAKTFQDSVDVMRKAIQRKNKNDPDSTDAVLLGYIFDVMTLFMVNDVKLFENFGTLLFNIDETNPTSVYNIDPLSTSLFKIDNAVNFSNYGLSAFISLLDPPGSSVSWNPLNIYQDPAQFFSVWGVNNVNILIPGYPTDMLYYGTEFTFRTIPNTTYQVRIYGYKINNTVDSGANKTTLGSNIPFSYWVRYLAYSAAMNYARDYKFDANARQLLKEDLAHETKLLLTHTHNQSKLNRAFPRF